MLSLKNITVVTLGITTTAWADTLIYPYLNLSQEQKTEVAISICLHTSDLAMQAMNDRQSNQSFEEGLKNTLSFSIAQVDTDGLNDFYKAFIEEQYRLAYTYPIMNNHQEKHALVKQLRDRELKRCGSIYGVENIGQYFIYFQGYSDLRPKDFV